MPPDVNSSDTDFAVAGSRIHFGLSAIKACGGGAADAIVAARKLGGPFQSLFDFCERVDSQGCNRATIEALVKAGAFDCLKGKRAQFMAAIDRAMQSGAATEQLGIEIEEPPADDDAEVEEPPPADPEEDPAQKKVQNEDSYRCPHHGLRGGAAHALSTARGAQPVIAANQRNGKGENERLGQTLGNVVPHQRSPHSRPVLPAGNRK